MKRRHGGRHDASGTSIVGIADRRPFRPIHIDLQKSDALLAVTVKVEQWGWDMVAGVSWRVKRGDI